MLRLPLIFLSRASTEILAGSGWSTASAPCRAWRWAWARLDDRGATVVSLPRTFSVEDFGSARSADDRFEVPLAQLTPGPHLLTVEATLGKTTVRRDVRFDVR